MTVAMVPVPFKTSLAFSVDLTTTFSPQGILLVLP